MTLGRVLYSFFEDYLKVQKGMRPASVKGYRDAIRLFLQFVAKERGCRISKLSFSDLTHERVIKFLRYLEGNRLTNPSCMIFTDAVEEAAGNR